MIAAANATIQANISVACGGNYGLALALVTSLFFIVTIIVTALGKEAPRAQFGLDKDDEQQSSCEPVVS